MHDVYIVIWPIILGLVALFLLGLWWDIRR